MSEALREPALTPAQRTAQRSRCRIYDGRGEPRPIHALAEISDVLVDPEAFVWLDIVDPQPYDFDLLAEEFGLHPLAMEDALIAHQRPKIEAYPGLWFVVVHGATHSGDELNIHELAIFAGTQYLITVRSAPPYPLDDIERRWGLLPPTVRRDSGALLYTILDTVVDGYTPIADAFEQHVERLESALLGESKYTKEVLLDIYAMKKDLSRFRRAVVPVHDILNPILRGDMQLFGVDEMPYYRDVRDHVTRVVEQMDAARELINNARDTHVSIVSHRQNEVAKQLTIVATIFLPLTFITGFFGQNFGWLVNHIADSGTFALWGVGSEIAAVLSLLAYSKYRGWF